MMGGGACQFSSGEVITKSFAAHPVSDVCFGVSLNRRLLPIIVGLHRSFDAVFTVMEGMGTAVVFVI